MDGAMSTLMELTVVLVVCPALLAAWLDNRYPWLRPREMRRITVAGDVPVSVNGERSIVRSGNADHFSSIDHLIT